MGKTTVTLGTLNACVQGGYKAGFIKPVGQQYVTLHGTEVDKDVCLVESVLGSLEDAVWTLSPVIVPSGFTEKYLQNRDPKPLHRRILSAVDVLSERHEFLVVEGTGHAGVGACFDLSNAEVARLLGSRVVIVTEGGIGRALDEVALSLALYRQHGVEVLGVIANKVYRSKADRVRNALSSGLKNLGSRLLGCIPYEAQLTYPRMSQIARLFGSQTLCGKEYLEQHVEGYVVAAMEPQHALQHIMPGALVIMPGDRVDNMLIVVGAHLAGEIAEPRIAGILLTGGMEPPENILKLLRKSGLAVLMTDEDTYTATARIRSTVFKIEPLDSVKIQAAERLVQRYVDLDYILENLT